MKVWLDDVRPAPDGWVWCKCYSEAIARLETGQVETISLDHDLGMAITGQSQSGLVTAVEDKTAPTGYDVACWIETAVHLGEIKPPAMYCHSANPVGKKRIEAVIESVKKHS